MVVLVRLDSLAAVSDAHLRDTIALKFGAGRVESYLVAPDGVPRGFIQIEPWYERDEMSICKLYVLPQYRGVGTGRAAMEAVEAETERRGLSRVTLHPKPFDASVTQSYLVRWYGHLGYLPSPGEPTTLVKRLAVARV